MAEVVGRNARFMQGPDSDPAAVAELRDAVACGRPTVVELVNHRKNGSKFWNQARHPAHVYRYLPAVHILQSLCCKLFSVVCMQSLYYGAGKIEHLQHAWKPAWVPGFFVSRNVRSHAWHSLRISSELTTCRTSSGGSVRAKT